MGGTTLREGEPRRPEREAARHRDLRNVHAAACETTRTRRESCWRRPEVVGRGQRAEPRAGMSWGDWGEEVRTQQEAQLRRELGLWGSRGENKCYMAYYMGTLWC